MTVVDAHSHFLPDGLIEFLRSGEYPLARVEDVPGSGPWVLSDTGVRFPLAPLFYDLETKVAWMDEHGIDVSLTSVAAPLFLYELEPEESARVCAMVNDAAAKLAEQTGGRLVGVATVPMTAPDLAAAELRRACGIGLKGVEIGTSVGDMMLDDPSLDPVYAAADELGAPVFVHPYTSMLGQQPIAGLRDFFLSLSVGNPLETHMAAARLMLGGVLDRHPGLTVQLSHAGGGLPFQLGRISRTYEQREEVRANARRHPTEYLDRFLFDTVVYDERALDFLLALVGPDNVVFGTDHPFDIADLSALDARARLGDDVVEKVFAANARAAYGL